MSNPAHAPMIKSRFARHFHPHRPGQLHRPVQEHVPETLPGSSPASASAAATSTASPTASLEEPSKRVGPRMRLPTCVVSLGQALDRRPERPPSSPRNRLLLVRALHHYTRPSSPNISACERQRRPRLPGPKSAPIRRISFSLGRPEEFGAFGLWSWSVMSRHPSRSGPES